MKNMKNYLNTLNTDTELASYVDWIPFPYIDSFHIVHNWAEWFKKILILLS